MLVEAGTKLVDGTGRVIATCIGIEGHGDASILRSFTNWQIPAPVEGDEPPSEWDEWFVQIPMFREPQFIPNEGKSLMGYHQFVRLETGWMPEDPTQMASYDVRAKWRGTEYGYRFR